MKRVALAVAVFLGAAGLSAAGGKPQKLDGTYVPKSGERDGEVMSAEELKEVKEVVIKDGVITAVGANVAVPPGATVIDATGKWVTPGLFNAGTQVGLTEISAVPATNDGRLAGNEVARTIQAIIEYDPEPPLGPIDWRWVEDAKIGPTLLGGVTPALREILAGKPELAKKLFP